MFGFVQVPVWLLTLILGFAAVTFGSHFLFPSVRWFFRRRVERLVERVNARLDRPVELFRLTRRQDMIVRLLYDPKVLQAVADRAAETGVPGTVALEEARRYAREIVPGFSATVYFGFGARAARWLSQRMYKVRVGGLDSALSAIDPSATVIFVINHRSNMDYVLVTWLVSLRATLSYAVGEWARVWPLSGLVRSMGGYFIRRSSHNTLYRRVLARYVQMITEEGVTQAIFPEGGLSLDGAMGSARVGLLSYILQSAREGQGGGARIPRDVVFVPVGLSYDRVLEDRVLTEAHAAGERRFRARPWAIAAFVARVAWRLARKRFAGFGSAAAAFGAPLSLQDWMARNPEAPVERLGADLMAEIAEVVPVLPVPLVAAALAAVQSVSVQSGTGQSGTGQAAGQGDYARLAAEVTRLIADLSRAGAVMKLPPSPAEVLEQGLRPLIGRKIVTEELRIAPGGADLVEFYARPLRRRLDPSRTETRKT